VRDVARDRKSRGHASCSRRIWKKKEKSRWSLLSASSGACSLPTDCGVQLWTCPEKACA